MERGRRVKGWVWRIIDLTFLQHTQSSVAKISFVFKKIPQTINKHSERKTTPAKKTFFPNSASRKEVLRRMNKNEKGREECWRNCTHHGKKHKNAKNTLNFWEDKLINSNLISESDILQVDNGAGGSGGEWGANICWQGVFKSSEGILVLRRKVLFYS